MKQYDSYGEYRQVPLDAGILLARLHYGHTAHWHWIGYVLLLGLPESHTASCNKHKRTGFR
jgi:hypothetical protein